MFSNCCFNEQFCWKFYTNKHDRSVTFFTVLSGNNGYVKIFFIISFYFETFNCSDADVNKVLDVQLRVVIALSVSAII